MAYINPNTTIYLCSNVPLDPSYDHTFYWSSASSQLAYFKSMAKYTLTKYSYQRVQRGYLRCECVAEDIYDVNYMIFQNTAFGDRWFYAFVDCVEYVNDATSDVFFTIDVMQTWLFDYEMQECWIDRQHSETDEIGEHIEPEPLEVGEYGLFTDYESFGLNEIYFAAIICEVDDGFLWVNNNISCAVVQNVPTATNIYLFSNDSDGVAALTSVLKEYVKAPESVVSIYTLPKTTVTSVLSNCVNSGEALPTTVDVSAGYYVDVNVDGISKGDAIGWRSDNQGSVLGYVPRNKKLYCYPYCFYGITTPNGSVAQYPYEYFYGGTPTFRMYGCILPQVTVECYPRYYKSMTGNQTSIPPNLSSGVELSGWPQGSWACDSYSTWVSSGQAFSDNSGAISSIASAVGAVAGVALAPATGGASLALAGLSLTSKPDAVAARGAQTAAKLATGLADITTSIIAHKRAADQVQGNANTGSATLGGNILDLWGAGMSISQEELERYDTYFDRFGYKLSKQDVPNRCARPYWTYLKTTGCTISGSVPSDDMKVICKIYDNGITFWNGNATTVLDYSLDNTV